MQSRSQYTSKIRTVDGLLTPAWLPSGQEFKPLKPGDDFPSIPDLGHFARTPLSGKLSNSETSLQTAWRYLSKVAAWNAETLTALLIVLIESVPELLVRPITPLSMAFTTETETIQPTAAHPRAYKGTKHKPPKSKSVEPIDLRPFLSDPVSVSNLLQQLEPYWDDAVIALEHQNYRRPSVASAAFDPYAAWNHDSAQPILLPSLTDPFKSTLLPFLRNRSWADIERLHALFHRLRLEDNEDLLEIVIGLVSNSASAGNTAAWCDIIAHLPTEKQVACATMIIGTGAGAVDPKTMSNDCLATLLEVIEGPDPAYRTYRVLLGAAEGVQTEYLLSAFHLLDRLEPIGRRWYHNFNGMSPQGSFPEQEGFRLISYLEAHEDFDRRKMWDVWHACGKLSGFREFLTSYNWYQWPPVVAQVLCHVFVAPLDSRFVAEWQPKFNLLRDNAQVIDDVLISINPEYQWKFCNSLRSVVAETPSPDLTRDSILRICSLLARICRKPFHPRRDTSYVWVDFVSDLSASQFKRCLAAPDTCFVRMEKACGTNNTRRHIGHGIWPIASTAPDFLAESFLNTPTRLFKTAQALGCLSAQERLLIVAEFMKDPIVLPTIDSLGDTDLYAHLVEYLSTIVPANLIAHYKGEVILNEPRLLHYQTKMRQEYLHFCLDKLKDLVLDRLVGNYPLEALDENTEHALRLERGSDENRKALRKFLTAYWNGRHDYTTAHPLTKEWLAQHPKLNVELWTKGISFKSETTDQGSVSISLETDPLEALKLGTHVGSCLSLGGIFESSAAATVLDINKQVLYARDSKGTIIGRQVVAWSERDELVRFSVYPVSAKNELRQLFAHYNTRFAESLNVPIYQENHSDEKCEAYKIADILSKYWYDDGAWDGEIED